MSSDVTAKTMSAKVGISPSYASMILNGDRSPPLNLAIAIYRKTGWRHASISKLNTGEMAVFEKHNPWVSKTDRSATQQEAA